MAKKRTLILEQIEPIILTIRGQRVMLDADLAKLYGVSTKRLNEQVRRNRQRFPADFLFQLSAEESVALRSQNATLADGEADMRSQTATASKRNVRYLPFAFTEHGAIMAASVLNTPRAVDMSVYVVRVFVKLRGVLLDQRELALKLAELEQKVEGHDDTIRTLVAALRELMAPPPEPKRGRLGFQTPGSTNEAKKLQRPPR
jgi:hypothetical protein